jgi:hypothetical protein
MAWLPRCWRMMAWICWDVTGALDKLRIEAGKNKGMLFGYCQKWAGNV